MTPAEALPFHLCLRLGVEHPDLLYDRLSAKQLDDWRQFAAQFCVEIGRDDPFHAWAISVAYNAAIDGPSRSPEEFMLYDRREFGGDDETQEEFVERVLSCLPLPISTSTSGSTPRVSSTRSTPSR